MLNGGGEDGALPVGIGLGLARGLVMVVLVLCLLPAIVEIVSPDFAESLRTGSVLYSYVTQMDFLNVGTLVTGLIGG